MQALYRGRYSKARERWQLIICRGMASRARLAVPVQILHNQVSMLESEE